MHQHMKPLLPNGLPLAYISVPPAAVGVGVGGEKLSWLVGVGEREER